MSITYEHKYDVTYIYNKFKKNRVNAVSYLGTSNNEKLEPDSSAYLSYINNSTETYIYARKSSPTIDGDKDKNYAYLKVGDTTYNLYHSHAYTYTETVTGNGLKPILIAYDFVNQISTQLEFKDVSISHNASPISDIPQTVNVFSPVSYIIENGEKSLDPKNEYSISKKEINTLLNGKTFADFTTYVTYSYLNSEKGDGIVYDDGKDTLSTNPINDIHVWSMSPGHDSIGFAYEDINVSANGNKKIKAYAHIHCGDVILNKLYNSSDNYIANNEILEFKYVSSAVGRPIPEGTCLGTLATSGKINRETGVAYICESSNDATGQRLNDFVKCAYSYNLGEYSDKSFREIYTHPSYRNNTGHCEFYELIQGKKYNVTSDSEQVRINEIENKNVNTTYFITNVYNLKRNIIDEALHFDINVNSMRINGNNHHPIEGYDTVYRLFSSIKIYFGNIVNNKFVPSRTNGETDDCIIIRPGLFIATINYDQSIDYTVWTLTHNDGPDIEYNLISINPDTNIYEYNKLFILKNISVSIGPINNDWDDNTVGNLSFDLVINDENHDYYYNYFINKGYGAMQLIVTHEASYLNELNNSISETYINASINNVSMYDVQEIDDHNNGMNRVYSFKNNTSEINLYNYNEILSGFTITTELNGDEKIN